MRIVHKRQHVFSRGRLYQQGRCGLDTGILTHFWHKVTCLKCLRETALEEYK